MKRLFPFFVLGLAVLAWAAPSEAAEADPVMADPSAKGFVGLVFSSEKLKEAIDGKLEGFQYVAMGIGFLLLVFPSVNGLIRRGLNPESITRYVTQPILLCGFIAITPEIQVVMSAGCDGLAEVMGYNPTTTVESYYGEMKVFDLKGAASALRPDSAVLVESTILDKMGSALTALRDLSRWSVQAAISVPVALLFVLLSYATMISILIAEILRHVALSAGYALLPVFIAGLNSEMFKRSAYAYAMRMVGVHLWSVAWSLIGTLTLVMVHFIRLYVDNLFTTAAIDPAGEFGLVELVAVTPTVVVVALSLTMVTVTTWQIYGLIKAPILLTKLLTAGGEAFETVMERFSPAANQTLTVNPPPISMGTATGSSGSAATNMGPTLQTLFSSAGGAGPLTRSSRSAGEMNEVFSVAGQRALDLAKPSGGIV